MNVDRALDYLDFVRERHLVWRRRRVGQPAPWTEDPILRSKKFTNVFRILDPGTQLLMRNGFLEGDPADVLMRCFLYRHTGRVEVWDWLVAELLGQPTRDDIEDVYEALMEYRGESKKITCGSSTVGGPLRRGRKFERSIFTGAYLVFPQSQTPGTDKLRAIIDLTARLFDPSSDNTTVMDFMSAIRGRNAAGAFAALRRNNGVADFMSMQILTDYGYGPGELDDSFVVAGPGAVRGAEALQMKPLEAIRWAEENLPDEVFLRLPDGRHRRPTPMDLQNTLCEFSKYVRYLDSDKPHVAPYSPAHPGKQLDPVLPAHW